MTAFDNGTLQNERIKYESLPCLQDVPTSAFKIGPFNSSKQQAIKDIRESDSFQAYSRAGPLLDQTYLAADPKAPEAEPSSS